MKLTKLFVLFLSVLWCLFARAQNRSSNTKLKLHFENASLTDVFKEISRQTSFKFSYSNSAINLDERITLTETTISLEDALNKILTPRNIEWKIVNETIALKVNEKPLAQLCIKLRDSVLQSPVPFAIVAIKETNRSEQTDYYGDACITRLKAGNYTLYIHSLGYKAQVLLVTINSEKKQLNIDLIPENIKLEEVIVTSDKIIENTSVSEIQVNNTQIETAKGFSNDPMKAITMLPGINAQVDLYGPADIHVRGGESNENLFLLDNIRLPYPFYVLGQSAINPEMIDKTEVLTGCFSPNYGNAMSSVFNYTTKTGDMESYSGNIDFNFLNTSALIQGPVVKNKVSIVAGFRMSNLNWLLKGLDINANMNDVNTKLTYVINEKNKINFTFLNVTDKLDLTLSETVNSSVKANNHIHAENLQWQSVWGKKVYSKLSLLQSGIYLRANLTGPRMVLNNHTYSLREDISIYPNSKSKLKTGAEINFEDDKSELSQFYKATDISISDSSKLILNEFTNRVNPYGAAYLFYERTFPSKLSFNSGLRLDYNYLSNRSYLSPRLTLMYAVLANTAVSAGWGYFYQAPSTYQITQNNHLKSNKAEHYVLSIKTRIKQTTVAKLEGYYKNYSNLVIFDTAFRYTNSGYGSAKGIELSLFREKDKLNGWISYAYSLTDRKRNLQDNAYPAYYDQRHAINVQLNYYIPDSSKKNFIPSLLSMQFKYATGTPYTPVTGLDSVAGNYYLLFDNINSQRNKDYINLNAKIEWKKQFGKQKNHLVKYYLDFWNILGSKNILERIYSISEHGTLNVQNRVTVSFLFSFGIKLCFNSKKQ
jgi:outer membrane receptor for ferrienterochelin and colicin